MIYFLPSILMIKQERYVNVGNIVFSAAEVN